MVFEMAVQNAQRAISDSTKIGADKDNGGQAAIAAAILALAVAVEDHSKAVRWSR